MSTLITHNCLWFIMNNLLEVTGLINLGAINDWGQVVGAYTLAENNQTVSYGFLRSPNGLFTTLGAVNPTGINDLGEITGFTTGTSLLSGFLRSPFGMLETFQVPGAIQTIPRAISNSGAIAGLYQDSAQSLHVFIRR